MPVDLALPNEVPVDTHDPGVPARARRFSDNGDSVALAALGRRLSAESLAPSSAVPFSALAPPRLDHEERDRLTLRNLSAHLSGHYLRAFALALLTVPIVFWNADDTARRLRAAYDGGVSGRVEKEGGWMLTSLEVDAGFVMFRVVALLFMNALSLVIVLAVYGWWLAKEMVAVMYMPMTVASIVFVLMIWETVLGQTEFIAMQFFFWTVVFIVVGMFHLSKRVGDPRIRAMLPAMFVAYLVLTAVYYFLVPALFSGAGSELARAGIRIILHPILFEITSLYGRHVVRQLSAEATTPDALWTMVHPILVLNSLFGRLLMFTMSSLEGSIVTTFLLAVLEISMRLTTASRDRLAFRAYEAMNKDKKVAKDEQTAEAVVIAHVKRERRLTRAMTADARAQAAGGKVASEGAVAPTGSAEAALGPGAAAHVAAVEAARARELEEAADAGGRAATRNAIASISSDADSVAKDRTMRYKLAFHTDLGRVLGPSMIAVDSISEIASILTMTAFVWTMRLSLRQGAKSIADDPVDVLVSSAVQLGLEFITDFLCLAYELKYHGHAHALAWDNRCKHHFLYLSILYFSTTFYFVQAASSFLCGAQRVNSDDFETFYCA